MDDGLLCSGNFLSGSHASKLSTTPEPGRDAFPSYRNPFLQVQRWGYKRGLIPLSLEGVQGFGL